MQLAATNGMLVLQPSAWVLASWANAGRFDAVFYTLQGVELLAGVVNWTLLTLNTRDGLRMAGRGRVGRPSKAQPRLGAE
ncbi:hypothetical protein ACFSF0_09760 [Ottowia flava]|uniref:Uncharacterized protein n=1 Tax=Ottowia flava TaxID=2675430 RepID=A0ABW4KX27_9BURK|nr:hypothetical protein [Ottowia sp. GY511]